MGVFLGGGRGGDRSARKGGRYDRAKKMASNKHNRVTAGRGSGWVPPCGWGWSYEGDGMG